jgi:hypothetical protein
MLQSLLRVSSIPTFIADWPSSLRFLPLCFVDHDLKRCQRSRERGSGITKLVCIFETEGSAITMKVFISCKRDFRQKTLGCSACLSLIGRVRPRSVRPVIIYLVNGETDTTGHFGRSVEQVSDLQ